MNLKFGSPQRVRFRQSRLHPRIRTIDEVESVLHRLTVEDRSGVVAKISQILGNADISIASVLQREAPEAAQISTVPLIMMLHTAKDRIVREAIAEIDRFPGRQSPDGRHSRRELRLTSAMALIKCPECGQQVSTAAQARPGCGFPVAECTPANAPDTQTILLEVRPSWWNFGWHLVFAWLLIPLLMRSSAQFVRDANLPGRVSIEEGYFSKETTEFFIKDIRSIEVVQGMWGRLVGIGNVTISTAATVDAAEEAAVCRTRAKSKTC